MSMIKVTPQVAIDGMGEVSEVRRPLDQGEVAEWILLDAVCTSSNLISTLLKSP
jgi:hypothetical protein